MLPPDADGIGLPRGTALALNESVRTRAWPSGTGDGPLTRGSVPWCADERDFGRGRRVSPIGPSSYADVDRNDDEAAGADGGGLSRSSASSSPAESSDGRELSDGRVLDVARRSGCR